MNIDRTGTSQRLFNICNYTNKDQLIQILKNYHQLRELASIGHSSAHDVIIDIGSAINSNCLDEVQKICVKEVYINGKTQMMVAQELNFSQFKVNKICKNAILALIKHFEVTENEE